MGNVDRTAPVYPIGVVQKLTGLSGRQIRYYETTGLVIPARTKGNQRLYSPEEVDKLLRIKKLLSQGYTIEGIKTLFAEEEKEIEASHRPEIEIPHTQLDDVTTLDRLRGGRPLTSLYPVKNQALLARLLQQFEQDQEPSADRSS